MKLVNSRSRELYIVSSSKPELNLDSNSSINTINASTAATINNEGSLKTVNTKPSDVNSEPPAITLRGNVDNVVVANNTKIVLDNASIQNYTGDRNNLSGSGTIGGKSIAGGGSGGGGSSRGGEGRVKSSAKDILTFAIGEPDGTVNNTNHSIDVTVPSETDVTALTPALTVSAGAAVSPASGITQDFTSPVTYTVTAQDGSTQDYVVAITLAATSVKAQVLFIEPVTVPCNEKEVVFNIYDAEGNPLANARVYVILLSNAKENPGTAIIDGITLDGNWRPVVSDSEGKVIAKYTSAEGTTSGMDRILLSTQADGSNPVLSLYSYETRVAEKIAQWESVIRDSREVVFFSVGANDEPRPFNKLYVKLTGPEDGGTATYQNGATTTILKNGLGYQPVISGLNGALPLNYMKGTNTTGGTDTIHVALDAEGTNEATMTYVYKVLVPEP